MLGYKLYYDKDTKEFVCEEQKSEMVDMTRDSTTVWFDRLEFAKRACKSRNDELVDKYGDRVKICKDCGESFWYTYTERLWLEDRGLKPYVRCYKCRKKKKEKK